MLTVSAVFSDITLVQVDFGTGIDFLSGPVMEAMAIGEQYVPRVAKVAYAEAIVSGETSWVPSAMEGPWPKSLPSERSMPIFFDSSMTGQVPISLIICTK